ncbi:MAG: hypothetical protein A4S17_05540 [Proteobacteria bacterium HN_bin10]|nr:MAG: hypothetical protein A4S17_05540 [Proteobacteria bacterium HN_bin10]
MNNEPSPFANAGKRWTWAHVRDMFCRRFHFDKGVPVLDCLMAQPLDRLTAQLRALKPELAEKFGVSGFAVFGSYARNEAGPDSDLDLLLDFSRTPSLFELSRLDQILEQTLGVKVDTVPRDSLNPRYAAFILPELVPV